MVEVPALLVERVVDTTGAGDAFLGGIIAGDIILNDLVINFTFKQWYFQITIVFTSFLLSFVYHKVLYVTMYIPYIEDCVV